ncbi:MAG: hypothetical protein JWL72_4345 [Ilumatobacteraceae bacterium]|nr:hypothetical protein [Ilumatobacteraceae bacterium]MCU1391007.1 hypothetical protein [Ilumatobacteraceae bacterium]
MSDVEPGGIIVDPAALDISSVTGSRPNDGDTPPAGLPIPPAPPRRRRGLVLKVGLALVLLLIAYYAINLFQVWQVGRSDQARPVDAIIVMGAAQYDGRPSPQLQARLDHVVELWNEGLAPLVIVTGGNQPGDRFTEASTSAQYLTEHGVDPAAIAEEDHGHSSWESLAAVAPILTAHGARTVLLVSDPYHSLRIRLMAQELGFVAYVSPTRTSPVRGTTAFGKEIKEAAGISLGRIIGFDRLLSITG